MTLESEYLHGKVEDASPEAKDAVIANLWWIINRTYIVLNGTEWDSVSWRGNLEAARNTIDGLTADGRVPR